MVLPIELMVAGNPVSIIGLGIVLFIIIYAYSYWLQSRKEMSYLMIFDVIVLGLFAALIFSRALAVILNYDVYSQDPWGILNFTDKNFFYIGIFLGLLFSVFFLYNLTSRERNFYKFLEKVVVSYALGAIPLLAAAMLAGKMPGIIVEGGIGIPYQDGALHMPVNIFRISYNILFLVLWLIFGKGKNGKSVMATVYLMLFAALEFILRIFSAGYSANYFNAFDLQQLCAVVVMLVGIILLMDINNVKLFKFSQKKVTEDDRLERKYLDRLGSRVPQEGAQRERFSMSYSSIQDSVNLNELSLKEKLSIFGNTLKRKNKK